MQPDEVMEMAVDHASKADEFAARGDLASARIHRELAAMYVPMAREVRIGNARSSTYRNLAMKHVVVAEPPALDTEPDELSEFGNPVAEGESDLPNEQAEPAPAPWGAV